jgi:hypothetical protein
MTAVNKLLNVVCACEIRGRLRCSAASIGYRGWIRKGFVHSPVTRLSRNPCQARNYHRRGIPADQGRGRELRVRAPVPRPTKWLYLRAECAFVAFCVELASPAGADRRRRESRLIRPPTDVGTRRSPAAGRVRVFPRASAPWAGGACFRVFQKNRKIQERAGRLHGSTETRNGVSCRWPTGGLRRAPVA